MAKKKTLTSKRPRSRKIPKSSVNPLVIIIVAAVLGLVVGKYILAGKLNLFQQSPRPAMQQYK